MTESLSFFLSFILVILNEVKNLIPQQLRSFTKEAQDDRKLVFLLVILNEVKNLNALSKILHKRGSG